MKKGLIFLAVIGLFTFSPSVLIAQDGNGDETEVVETVRNTNINELRKEFQQRLKDYRGELQERYSQAKERALENRCESVIAKLEQARNGSSKFHESHNNIYTNWRQRLAEISNRLAVSGIDTSTLEGLLEELDTLLNSNNSDVQSYLADLENVTQEQCQEDPEAFYESIQNARAARKLIIENHKETVQFIKENIKAELLSIRQQLSEQVVEEAE